MILIGQYDSLFTRRVAIALHHYGLPFVRDTRSVFTNAAEISKFSPLTRIPALVLDDGEVLIDSSAILDYLDELVGPDRALMPPFGAERRYVLQATALCQTTGEKAGIVVYERHFHPPAAISREWESRCLGQIASGLAEMERRCDAPWFCGTAISHADIMAVCAIGYFRLRLPEVFPIGPYPKLDALATRCEALSPFVNAQIGANDKMPAKS